MQRSILGLLLCLLVAACGEKTSTKATASTEKAQPAAIAPTAPVVIPAHKMKFSRVGASALRPDSASEAKVDTVQGKFLVIRDYDVKPRLLYRAAATDSVWTEIELELPAADDNNDWTNSTLDLSFRNLDRRGAPEVLATCEASTYGTGGGTRWTSINLIDVSQEPLLLLGAFVEQEDENFGRDDSQPEGRRTDAGYERYTGWRRAIKLGPTLELGEAEPIGALEPIAENNGPCPLTKLIAGRYRYQPGGLVRVGK